MQQLQYGLNIVQNKYSKMNLKNSTIGAILGNMIDGFHWFNQLFIGVDWQACLNAFLVSAFGAIGYTLVVFILSKFGIKNK